MTGEAVAQRRQVMAALYLPEILPIGVTRMPMLDLCCEQ
jgi:hypothetical protein